MLTLFDGTLHSGVQLSEFFSQVLSYTRDLMILAAGARNVSLQSVFNSHRDVLQQQADQWGMQAIMTAMQILSETKTQMGRSINARALAELALIRLCHLGDLRTLAVALKALEAGRPLVLGNVSEAATSVAPPLPATSDSAQKKTLTDQPISAEQPGKMTVQEAEIIDLADATKQNFLSEVIERIEDKVKLHLSSCSETAISGPNQLEIFFPVKYDLSRRYCEKAENLKMIESTASEVAGRQIQIRIKTDVDTASRQEGATTAEAVPNPPAREPTDLENVQDPLIHKAIDTLNADLVKVQPLGKPAENQEG
jgi:DNA polymerase-3 subunit gamma/tau